MESISDHAEGIFGSSEECAVLDLDGTGGKTFLRVLLHLGMHDYPPLVLGALQLLFRHFSQRQEVLGAFKQVQLLGMYSNWFLFVLLGVRAQIVKSNFVLRERRVDISDV